MPMQLAAVIPGLRTDVVARSATTGRDVRITTYAGCARFDHVRQGFVEAVDPRMPLRAEFFLPDSLSYPSAPPEVGLELGWRSFSITGANYAVPQAIVEERVEVAPDPGGGPDRWLRIALAITCNGMVRHEVGYRVTAVSPLP